MFNRQYHLRAVRSAGGGHALADRVLAATEGGAFYRPNKRPSPGISGPARLAPVPRKKNRRDELQLAFDFPLNDDQLAEEFERLFGG